MAPFLRSKYVRMMHVQNTGRILPYYRTSGYSQLASVKLGLSVQNTLVRRTDFCVLHIAKRKNGSRLSSPPIAKSTPMRCAFGYWRRGQDSNLRALASKLISSQPRYDHFDTSPYAPLSMRSLIKITYLVRKIKRFYLTCQISFAYCSMARSEENLPALAILSMLLV